ncbi:MAG TPA: transglycosylase domain-containing protein [Myxococcota bacterium]|nr:transglycosylase domain-containing protein [Myxococcota bacterium]
MARRTLIRAGIGLGALAALVGVGLGGLYAWVVSDLPDLRALDDYRPALTSRVYDRHGALIGEFYEERRQLTPMNEIPKGVVNAFLAAEDDTFYEHGGVDFVSMLRAAWVTFTTDETQGASTITQQLAKNLLLSSERTYTRKAKEVVLARRIEQRFDKDAILWRYLNHIYFGSGAYGVAEAARTYFDKPLAELTPSEAALIAGLPKAPGKFSPHLNPTRAEERRRYVLARMRDVGFLDEAAYEANLAPPPLKSPDTRPFEAAAYVTEEVRRRLVAELGNDFVLRGGLRIETTIDLALQETAVRALRSGIEALDHRRGYRGPLRSVKKGSIDAELAKLAEKNALTAGAPLAPELFEKPRTGIVLAVNDKQESARVAFGAGVEASVPFATTKWAHAKKSGSHGAEIAKLSQALAVGDVALFALTAPAADAKPGEPLAASLYQAPDVQGALLSFDVKTGDLLALVGGYDFADSEFDRATQAHRQAGSAFKPIVYASALAHGFTPATIVYDRPAVYDDGSGALWRPENYGRQFLGRLTLTEALARSINNVAVYVLSDVGLQPTIDLARALGVKSELDTGLSLALGTSSMTLLELTRAYGVFASGGRLVEPRLIARVLDREGELVIENVPLDGPVAKPEDEEAAEDEAELAPEDATRQLVVAESEAEHAAGDEEGGGELGGAVDEPEGEVPAGPVEEIVEDRPFPKLDTPPGFAIAPAHAFVVAQTLRAPVEHPNGTAGRAASLGPNLSGKTGTTNDQTDAWFVGFSPEVVTGVWVGIDARDVLGPKETGGRAALPIWMEYMKAALAERKPAPPAAPDGVSFVRVDTKTGKLAGAPSKYVMTQAFLSGTEPLERSAPASSGETGEAVAERKRRLDF